MRTRNAGKELLVKQKAMEMLVADGFEGFSVNKLARACNISVATLYIYYKDKDDLIIRIGIEEGKQMTDLVFHDFDPHMPFAAGLRKQWQNRFAWMMRYPTSMLFIEQLRSSSYGEEVFRCMTDSFKTMMTKFIHHAIDKGEINRLSLEAFWSTAFAPLYTLVRFHHEGRSIGGKPFTISPKVVWETFDIVLKGLTK